MSTHLNQDGLAHLWERIQELVATCGGSGSGGTSKSVNVPRISNMFSIQTMLYNGHGALNLSADNPSGSITLYPNAVAPTNSDRFILESIKSTANQNIFSKLTGYEFSYAGGTQDGLILYFASSESFTIPANSIEAVVIATAMSSVTNTSICYLEGSCAEESDDISA